MKILLFKESNEINILNVKNGYAKNYLFLKKMAVLATRNNLLKLKRKNIKPTFNKIKKSSLISNKLNNITLFIPVQLKKNKEIYGSLDTKKIINLIKKLGFNINNSNIVNHILIKKTGQYQVKLNLNNNISKLISINIITIGIEK